MSVDVVNSALGLAQYITASLSEPQAVSYLSSVEKLSHTDWCNAKKHLPTVDKTNRRSKESTIADIVVVFKNEDIDINFLVNDLSILPGLSREALELSTFIGATLYAAKSCATLYAKSGAPIYDDSLAKSSFRSTEHPVDTSTAQQLEVDFPSLEAGNPRDKRNHRTGSREFANSSLSPSGEWLKEKRRVNTRVQQQPKRTWIHGTSAPVNSNINHQLKFVCLGVRSGSEETAESLKAELARWNCLQDLKVEQVRKSFHSSTFRVQFNVAATLHEKWKDPNVWPARMSASQWRGNPKTPLETLEKRVYTKKMYVGNLPNAISLQRVKENMGRIYQEEIQQKKIQDIEVLLNENGLKRENTMKSKDPSHQISKSVCVILRSAPGVALTDISLKLDHYTQDIRRTVRHWRGPAPYPKSTPPINLTWS